MVRCYRGSYTPVIGTRVTVERAPDKNSWRVVGIAEDVLGVGTSAPFDMERQGIEVNYPIPLEAINHGLYNLEDGLTLTLFNVFHPTTSGVGFVASTTVDFAPFVPNTLGRWVTVAVAEDGSFHQNVSSVGVFDQDGWIVPANLAIANDRFPVLAVYLRSDTLNWGNEWRTLTKSIQWGSKFIIRIPYSWASSNGGGGGGEWGTITGTLSDQTDLQSALDAKLDADDYEPVTVGVPDNGLSILGQEISLSLADDTNAGAMPPDMFEVLSTGRTYLGYEFFTSSGTFTKASHPNAKWLKVTMCGGGGGGSSTANLTQCGSGGAGSGWCLFWIDINDISASEAVTVGAGGSAGVIGGGQGGTGGNSAFAGVTSGFGGGGGNPSVFNQGGTSYAGAGSANFRFSGSGGQSGGNIAGVGSGMGGSCAWGGGAQGRAGQSNVAGIAGSTFGGGGAGGTHPSHPAGAGAQGFVLIEVFG